MQPGKHGRKRAPRGVTDFVDREQFEAKLQIRGQFAGVVNRPLRRVRPGHANTDDVLRAERIGRNRRRQRGIDASAEPDDRPLEATFADVVARAQNQRFIGARFFPHDLWVHVSGQFAGVEIDQVFFKRLPLRNHPSIGSNHQTRSIEHQTVVSSDLVHHRDRHLLIARDGRQHVAPQLALAQPKRRRRDVEHEVAAGPHQFLYGIEAIQLPVPEAFVVPGIFADGQSEQHAGEVDQMLAFGGSEVARLVENVIGRQ